MSNRQHATVSLLLEDVMKTLLPPVDPIGFDAAYPRDRVLKIHTVFNAAVRYTQRRRSRTAYAQVCPEESIFEAWRALDKVHPLCAGYVLETLGNNAMYDGAWISLHDRDIVEKGLPYYCLVDLAVAFRRRVKKNSTADHNFATEDTEPNSASRTPAHGQLSSCVEHIFLSQHRTALFKLLVNGDQFRVIRWDRSGCIVTEAVNYVETVECTEKLLHFLYAYSQASPEQRGFDTTATRLSKDTSGWQRMQKVAMACPEDLDYTAGQKDADFIPDGFPLTPTRNAPQSPLFAANILPLDPIMGASGSADLSSDTATSHIIPVFQYVRDFFRKSIPPNRPCYALKVCGDYYLVCKPIFESRGLVGRGTRGYVALEWSTQRLVFLKDTWRSFSYGVEREGTTLESLNKAAIPFVPTLICHEDVGGPLRQEIVALVYTKKKSHVFVQQENKDRHVSPFPSRPRGSSPSPISRMPQKRKISVSDKGSDSDPSDYLLASEHRRKRPRLQCTAPVELKDKPGQRHLTHYRIVVAEVCLPSTAITCGQQLSGIIRHCIFAHRAAAVNCNILHRDVSSGNILVLPTAICRDPERRKWSVLWVGTLCDWELAAPLLTPQAESQALPTRRVGTWYYMSVHSQTDPELPVSIHIADELESFFHVLLYLAVRLLRTNLARVDVPLFIERYFASSELGPLGRGPTCGGLKYEVIRSGHLAWPVAPIHFLSQSCEEGLEVVRLTPLNELVAGLLQYFRARYAVLRYEARAQEDAAEAAAARPPVPESVMLSETQKMNIVLLQRKGLLSAATRPKAASNQYRSIVRNQRPSDDTYRLAAGLDTHDAVLALFGEVLGSQFWSRDDYAGDSDFSGQRSDSEADEEDSRSQESHSEATEDARLDGWHTTPTPNPTTTQGNSGFVRGARTS